MLKIIYYSIAIATRENSETEVNRSYEGEIATQDKTTNDSGKGKRGWRV
jgi:hypothetical protein